jgi:hypothetical protein
MPYVVGIVVSLGVALFARRVGFDRDRAFYPTVLIVIALPFLEQIAASRRQRMLPGLYSSVRDGRPVVG